ncbi:hypothetical protein SDC9_206809 [bioreactor metagenome]|uniref:Uncharacterized protein n=1 Tax=bioreactor metagenome TaxID=1076179 RepID=A0A645J646_9ZZZZ
MQVLFTGAPVTFARSLFVQRVGEECEHIEQPQATPYPQRQCTRGRAPGQQAEP